MYPHLGNEHNLKVIRDLNPDQKDKLIHCKLLKKNSNACNDIPLPGGARGVCPKNPYHPDNVKKRETLVSEFRKQYPQVMRDAVRENLDVRAWEILSATDMGLIRDLSQLTPIEFQMAAHYNKKRKAGRIDG